MGQMTPNYNYTDSPPSDTNPEVCDTCSGGVQTVESVLARWKDNPYSGFNNQEMAVISASRQLADTRLKIFSFGISTNTK